MAYIFSLFLVLLPFLLLNCFTYDLFYGLYVFTVSFPIFFTLCCNNDLAVLETV
jgi:hypothetical protein